MDLPGTASVAQWGDSGGDRGEHCISRSPVCPATHSPYVPRTAQSGPADVSVLFTAWHSPIAITC